MNSEEALLSVADEALFTDTGKHLEDIQRMILRESLAGKGYEKMEGYSPSHIKNKGYELWNLLSTALGEKVTKKNFQAALERRLKSKNEGETAALYPPTVAPSPKLGKVEIEALKAISRFEAKNPLQPPQPPVEYSVDD